MTNDKISDIANTIGLGENRYEESQLLAEAIRAGECVKMTDSGLELFDSYYGGGFLGVMKEHYEFDLDTDITEGKYGDVVTDGYCAVMIVDPTENLYPGTPLYPSVTKGKMGYTPSINLEPIATLKSTIVSGDDVAIVKLLR